VKQAKAFARLLGVLACAACMARPAQALVYCNITAVDSKELTNGVQIVVKADGVLNWRPEEGNWRAFYGGEKQLSVQVRFTNARLAIAERSINVNKFPVSYIQLQTPQDAKEGIGVTMLVRFTQPSQFSADLSEDMQSFLVTVESGRTIEQPGTRAAAAGGEEVKPELSVQYSDDLLSIRAVKADLHQLIGDIAAQTGVNIAVDDAVRRQVSMALQAMPVDAVIRGIASAYGLALSQVNGVYMMSEGVPTDLATYNRSGTESFPMTNLRAQTASSLLPTFLFSYLHVNNEQNAVVVTAPTQMLDKIRADLAKTDLPPPQILIEALAVELTSTNELDAGLTWHYRGTEGLAAGNSTTGQLQFRSLGLEDRLVNPDDPTAGLLPTDDLMANLKALLTKGKARIKACPRMAAMNGQKAELFIGAQRFIQVNYVQFGQQQTRIQGVDVGVTLDIVPWTGGNGEITTKIQAEVSNIASIAAGTGLPLLTTRRVESTVRVQDGETIVIGGLLQRQEETTRRKVPFFGDLPLVGVLFRSKQKTLVNSELVLFITPHILTPEGHLLDRAAEDGIFRRFLGEPLPTSGAGTEGGTAPAAPGGAGAGAPGPGG